MKYFIVFLISALAIIQCHAQAVKHKPGPAAKIIIDSAASKYMRAGSNKDSLKVVDILLDRAIKIDSLDYDAWLNKLTFQCRLQHFDNAIATLKKMDRIFRGEGEVQFLLGILFYKTGHSKDAVTTLNKLLKQYNTDLQKGDKDPNYKNILISKGIVLILVDNPTEGKNILHKLYNEEKDPYTQSYLGFYINSNKEEIINDRVPGN